MTAVNYTYIKDVTLTQDIGKVKLSKGKFYRILV